VRSEIIEVCAWMKEKNLMFILFSNVQERRKDGQSFCIILNSLLQEFLLNSGSLSYDSGQVCH
jgi:hypothetical protein